MQYIISPGQDTGIGPMTVDTREKFDLHHAYFKSIDCGDVAARDEALQAIEDLELHPEHFTLDAEELERRLVEFEERRLEFQNRLARLANHTLIGPKIKGEVSETSAALLRGSKGLGRMVSLEITIPLETTWPTTKRSKKRLVDSIRLTFASEAQSFKLGRASGSKLMKSRLTADF